MSHIFISYSHQDSDYAHKLEAELKRRGFEVWIDDRIDYGSQWPNVIQENLDASAAMIVIMTPRSYGSKWVQNELAYFEKKEKPIFPLLLEGEYWLSVAATQSVNVSDAKLPSPVFYDRLARIMVPRAPAPPIEERARIPAPPEPFEPEMILIPAGKFLMGSDSQVDKEADGDEQPQHKLFLPDYYLARTPVTNAQYLAFVRTTDQSAPGHWQDGEPPPGQEDHPVVYVSWDEAMVYCRWLARITGKPYRLPSEAEWEKGARGADGRIYPWSSTWDSARANTAEGGAGDTTPVDAYPGGASPYGLLDMAGNVREWTRSLRDRDSFGRQFTYPYNPLDGRENLQTGDYAYRVLRGGSYHLDRRAARCAMRNSDLSWRRWGNCGFRVCVPAQEE